MIENSTEFFIANPELTLEALRPEIDNGVGRSESTFEAGKDKLNMVINSPDFTAFRAAMNNYIRLIHTSIKTQKVIKNE